MENIIVFLVLLAIGYGFGRFAELRHFKSIRKREKALQAIPAIATKIPDPTLRPRETQLVGGSVVVSVDYFKRFIAGLRNLVGGRVTAYESLLDRARRERGRMASGWARSTATYSARRSTPLWWCWAA